MNIYATGDLLKGRSGGGRDLGETSGSVLPKGEANT